MDSANSRDAVGAFLIAWICLSVRNPFYRSGIDRASAAAGLRRGLGRMDGWRLRGRKGTRMAKTVLIVEDNELNMKLFHDLLEAHRSEERRVGKECRSVWAPYQKKKTSSREKQFTYHRRRDCCEFT